MSAPQAVRPRRTNGFPRVGAVIPGWSLRAALVILAVLLAAGEGTSLFWSGIAVALAIAAAVRPRWMTAWFMIVVLAGTVLTRHPVPFDWHPYALIAGAHLAHVLASWMLVAPARSWVQVRALAPSVARFLAIQLPVQVFAFGALWLASSGPGGSLPVVALIAAGALVLLTVVLIAPLLRERRG